MSRTRMILCWISPVVAAMGWTLLFGINGLLALTTGFIAHMRHVWPQLTWNPDLWVPALVAFLLAVVIGHRLLRGAMFARGVRWRFDHTVCLAGFVPLAFATAFLVPGTLLQLQLFVDAIRQSP